MHNDNLNTDLNATPRGNRLHIGFYGRRNAGKSSLVNALAGHAVSIVSDVPGTTTDPVYKSMEIHGLGPCVLIDAAGFDDVGPLGGLRVEKAGQATDKTDVAVLLLSPPNFVDSAPGEGGGLAGEKAWAGALRAKGTPCLYVINKIDEWPGGANSDAAARAADLAEKELGARPLLVSARTGDGLPGIFEGVMRLLPADWNTRGLTDGLANAGDVVLLVMPQDLQAPKGRLILPQVQTIRELLDKKCLVVSSTADCLDSALAALAGPPALIITDSQVFETVHAKKPPQSRLTSFSILMAANKGDLAAFRAGAEALGRLGPDSRVLVAEACTHAPLAEDIGREKIPALLRRCAGRSLSVDVVSGADFPADLTPYDVIIHCGGCMFNRKHMLARVAKAKAQGVPITNYGVTLAWLAGILDKVDGI